MSESFFRSKSFYWLVFVVSTLTFFALGVVITLVLERRHENLLVPTVMVKLDKFEADPAVWGRNFAREYESFQQTKEMGTSTKHGGPQPFSHLERNPALKVLFAGYPFAVEYNDDRGHYHALDDVIHTGRMDPARGGKAMPGTCMTCKTGDLPRLYSELTPEKYYSMPFNDVKPMVKNSISCSNCHDPETLELRITNLACREMLTQLGKNPDGLTRNEMRSMVCAQCHLEYYFKGAGSYLTLPWKYGTTPEAMEKYYDEIGFSDWTHKISKTPMVKMQHPDYELFVKGVHHFNGVTCADCHMPYTSQGGVKFSNHHVQSPLKNIANTCLVCHRSSEEELRTYVESVQDTTWNLQLRASNIVADAHNETGKALEQGIELDKLAPVHKKIRAAQLRVDFIASSNSMGFHAPQEAVRILAEAIDLGHSARLELQKILDSK